MTEHRPRWLGACARQHRRGGNPQRPAREKCDAAYQRRLRRREQDGLTLSRARCPQSFDLGELVAAQCAAREDDEQRRDRDRAAPGEQQAARSGARLRSRGVERREWPAEAQLAPARKQRRLGAR